MLDRALLPKTCTVVNTVSALKNGKSTGADAFYDYYSERWKERWPSLEEALRGEHAYTEIRAVTGGGGAPLPAGALPRDAVPQRGQPPKPAPYYLDPASVAVASLLPLPGAAQTTAHGGAPQAAPAQVLDLCAAPGGKTLVLAMRMRAALAAGGARLTANERSAARRGRLRAVIDTYLGTDLRPAVTVTGHDAARWGLHHPAEYDAVLADVPCSSERHVLGDPKELERWSPSRTRRLEKEQTAILAAAVDSAKPGGWVLYSTCALSDRENDGVVARILARRAGVIEIVDGEELLRRLGELRIADLPPLVGEATDQGMMILPDVNGGAGPLYCALLRRR